MVANSLLEVKDRKGIEFFEYCLKNIERSFSLWFDIVVCFF